MNQTAVVAIAALVLTAGCTTSLTEAERDFCLEDLAGERSIVFDYANVEKDEAPIDLAYEDSGYDEYVGKYPGDEHSEALATDPGFAAASERMSAMYHGDRPGYHARWLETDSGAAICSEVYRSYNQSIPERHDLSDPQITWCAAHLPTIKTTAIALGLPRPIVDGEPTIDDWSLRRPTGFTRACKAAYEAASTTGQN